MNRNESSLDKSLDATIRQSDQPSTDQSIGSTIRTPFQGEMGRQMELFDRAWDGGTAPRIADYLFPVEHGDRRQLLIELIKLDLEHRWRRAPVHSELESSYRTIGRLDQEVQWRWTVESYAAEFPELVHNQRWPLELIQEEYRVRRQWGDQPSHDAMIVRFPMQSQELSTVFRSMDRFLAPSKSTQRSSPSSASGSWVKGKLVELAVGEEIDDFRLLSELGRGSFARVFLAQQQSLQRLVALKISEERSSESPVLCSLDHPNIVRIFDERAIGPLHLMYMQYVPAGNMRSMTDWVAGVYASGGTPTGEGFLRHIESILAARGELVEVNPPDHPLAKLTWGETVAWIGARLADALTHAHSKAVWHRDIKPENILVTANGRPMLVDFNLSFGAQVQGAHVEDSFGGSLAYMSPEHLQVFLRKASSNSVNEASDVFSLAIVLWELLTGHRPYAETKSRMQGFARLEELMQSRLDGPDPNQLPADCPSVLKEVLLQCLQSDVATRLSSPTLVARQLQLCTDRQIDHLLTPAKKSWRWHWLQQPTFWLVLLGMLPSAVLSPINIWANHRMVIKNFDQEFFKNTEEPTVNLITFPLGVLLSMAIFLPIARGIRSSQPKIRQRGTSDPAGAARCLASPWMVAGLVFLLWGSSGLVFPLWNMASAASMVGPLDILGFFLSQILHGLIAASTSFVVISSMMTQAFYPRLMPHEESQSDQIQLDHLQRQIGWFNNCLALTPLLAILAIGLSDQFDHKVFVALAFLGFASHVLTSWLTPRILNQIACLKRILRPTSEMLY